MEKAGVNVAALTLFMLLPVALGVNSDWKDDTFCKEKDAACKMSSGNYGCCPAADGAVCCADGDHCCPSGFKCDLSAKRCLQHGADPSVSVDMLRVTPISAEEREVRKDDIGTLYRLEEAMPGDVGDVKCPDGSSCRSGSTCCLHISGGFSCCPNAYGNCCDDYTSCCGSGKVCDVAYGQCITPSVEGLDKIPFLVKPLKRSSNSNQPRL